MDVRPGYKQTEIGVFPADWEIRPIQSIAHVERGRFIARPRNDPKYFGGDIPFIQTGDVTHSSGRISTYSQTLNGEGLKVSKLFTKGTLFFTIAANIGDVGFVEFDAACPDSLVAITPAKSINKRWLAHELRQRKASFENLATHNAQLNINLEKLRPYLLPVPTSAEQGVIAEALSDADGLIECLEQLIAKKRQLKQGTMQELLTGEKRLSGFEIKRGYKPSEVGSIPKDWELRLLGEGIQLSSGQHVLARYCNVDGDGVAYITGPADFPEGVIQHTKFTTKPGAICRKHDILITVKGSGAGTLALADNEYCISRQLMAIRVRDWDTKYIYFCLLQNALTLSAAATGLIPGLSRADILEKAIPVPSAIAEQAAISAVLTDMDAEITSLEKRLAKAQRLKQGMMQELLTGRTRLV